MNRTFYSFGGNTPIKTAFNHRNPVDQFNTTFSSLAQTSKIPSPAKVIYKEPNVKMNDYTKNISLTIHSPGLIVKPK